MTPSAQPHVSQSSSILSLGASVAVARLNTVEAISSVDDILDHRLPAHGGQTAIRYDDGADYQRIDFDGYVTTARRMARRLGEVSQNRQIIIATLCKNRPEWDMAAMATFYTGNILFPLDTKTEDEELIHLLGLNPPDYVLAPASQVVRLRELLIRARASARIMVADCHKTHEDLDAPDLTLGNREHWLSQWLDEAKTSGPAGPSNRLKEKNLILGHYVTSGTTSLPKIVQISHGNIIAELAEALDFINLRPNEEVLNIGPYTHIATLLEFLVTKIRGYPVTYMTRDPEEDGVVEAEIRKLKRQGVRIKALMAVPKFWILVLKDLLEEMKQKPILRNLYEHLTAIEKHDRLYDIGTIDKAKLAAVRIALRNKFGGYFSYGVSSSSKLDGAIVEIFGKLGITVVDVYGATEASGIISRNYLDDVQPGTCGRIIRSLDYKILGARTVPGTNRLIGELAIKGPTVTPGYLGQGSGDHLNADGYFPTGDLAWVDDDRTVHLIGRGKDLIKWNDGSYIDPMHLSNLLVRSIFVRDALVTRLDPKDDFLSVFLLPDHKRLAKDDGWQADISKGINEKAALRRRLEAAIAFAQSIAAITPRLSTTKIYLLSRPLKRTPTHKIKLAYERARLDTTCFL